MASDEGAELVGQLEAQREVCVRLRQMAHAQRRLVTLEDPARLMALLADRQRLTDELRMVSDRVGNTTERLDAARERMTKEAVARAEELQSDVRLIVQEIMMADENDARLLTARKQQMKAAISNAANGQAALSAYRSGRSVETTMGSRAEG
ncbi:MAG: hypothetical protein HOP29_15560 [Phycisphaerales bacterium]|nr:hypothetical protein [Phycisphaerales bacterium]